MLQETLKQATEKDHTELESLMYVHEIMAGTLSPEHYRQILKTNYFVHLTFENNLFNGLSTDAGAKLHIASRYKYPALKADLDEAKVPEPILIGQEYPSFINDAEILGALYVLEGATLGGSVIVKKLKTNQGLSPLHLNFNYYQVYGDKLGERWRSFVGVLNEQPVHCYSSACKGAKAMFNFIRSVQKQV